MSFTRLIAGFTASVFLCVPLLSARPAEAAIARTVQFSGYTWNVRSDAWSTPGPNVWDGSTRSVFVDSMGQLHLKIVKTNGVWSSSEVYLPASLGYGTYTFEVTSRVDQLDTNVVASPFLYENDQREYDIEFSNWKWPGDWQGQFVVQPGWVEGIGTIKTNVSRFPLTITDGVSTHSMTWRPDSVSFNSAQDGRSLHSWTYQGSQLFAPGNEKLHINLWMIGGSAPSNGLEQEFIIKSFTFTPLSTSGGTLGEVVEPVPEAPQAPEIIQEPQEPAPAAGPTEPPVIEGETANVPAPQTEVDGMKPTFTPIPYTNLGYYCRYKKYKFDYYPYVYYEPRCEIRPR